MQRIKIVLSGIVMILGGILLFLAPISGYRIVILVLSVSFILTGIRQLVYYGTMARFMVGGRSILYRGIIILDVGLFTASLSDIPRMYVVIYLAVMNAFSGLIIMAKAMESRYYGDGFWKFDLFRGLASLAVSVLCIIYIKNPTTAVYIYSAGLIYSAATRMISAFRSSEWVYIQ